MKRLLLALSVLLVITQAADAGMKVKSESLEGADLSSYETYSWKAADPSTSGLMIAEGTRLAKKLEEIGDRALAKAGLEKKAAGEAALVIRYRGFAKEMVGAGGGASDLGSDVTWLVGSSPPPMVYKQGTLLVEALDAETEELLWAGWAQGAIEAIPKREKVAKKAEKAMAKIMKEFPR